MGLKQIQKEFYLNECKSLAQKQKGKCLSKEYVNAHTKLKWRCKEGHTWKANSNNIKNGKWCPICAHLKLAESQKLSIQDMQEIAEAHNGKCLSKEYINSKTKLKWQCKEGHIWLALPTNTIKGHWCSECAGIKKGTIKEMHVIVEKHGGKCLSKDYINSKTKLKWQCKEGHIWEAQPSNIKSGKWCPVCGHIKNAKSKILNLRR